MEQEITMKWEVGQEVHYTYKPDNDWEKKKEYRGVITFADPSRLSIRWDNYEVPMAYKIDSHIAKHMYLVHKLSESNPNRTFVRNKTCDG